MSIKNLSLGETNLDVFAKTMINLADQDRNILVTTSDSRGSGKITPFAERYPEQIVEIGIAEQNLVGISAGLAAMGKKVFAVSPACFLTARALEQIKNDIAYSDHPVKVIGISAGVSYGALGTTHHTLHDFAVLQAINNIDIVAPADNFETRNIIQLAVDHPRPIYIRFGKKSMPNLHDPSTKFELGKAIQLTPKRKNYDLTFVAIGETVAEAFFASQKLEKEGINVCCLSLHTLRPFDETAIQAAVTNSHAVITVEEHSVNGGLGSRVASFLMQAGIFRPILIVGIKDEHTVSGNQGEIFRHYGMDQQGLYTSALKLLRKGKNRNE